MALSLGNQVFLFILAFASAVVVTAWLAIELVKALWRGWRTRRGARW